MLATMIEPSPKFVVRPRPRPDEPLQLVLQRLTKVEAIQDTLQYALDRDGLALKQRDFMQQDLICGITVLKDYWHTERRDVVELRPETIGIHDALGNQVDSIYSSAEETTPDVLVK